MTDQRFPQPGDTEPEEQDNELEEPAEDEDVITDD